jgi:protein-S-isoprenylcysteine O-methyltransferase Ste14
MYVSSLDQPAEYVVSDVESRATLVGDLIARAVIVVLYSALARNLYFDFRETGRITGLMLLVSELLVVVFTMIRRPAQAVDRSTMSRALTLLSAGGPLLVRAGGTASLAPDIVTMFGSAVGVLIIIAAKTALGRSFGIVPANRGVRVGGVYGLVRHPMYAGYLVTHFAFALAQPTTLNLAILVMADVALVLRALREEHLLSEDAAYQAYCQRVAWHLIPGLF